SFIRFFLDITFRPRHYTHPNAGHLQRSARATLRPGNTPSTVAATGILTVRTAFYAPTMTAACSREKSLENDRPHPLHTARGRLNNIIAAGHTETPTNPPPPRAPSPIPAANAGGPP